MTAVPTAFQSSEGQFSFEGVAQLINGYAEKRGPDAKAPLSVVPCDGIVEIDNEATGPIRGMIYLEDLEKLYHCHSSSCFKTTYDGTTFTTVRIGTVPGIDQVQLARNQNASPQISVQSASGVQFISSDSLSYSADVDFPTDVVTAENANNYQLYGKADRTWFISSVNEAKTIDPLDFSTFEQKAGKLVRIVEHAGEVFGFCSSWFEPWRKTTDPDFPFSPMGARDVGLGAKNSVVRCDNSLLWIGHDGVVYRLNNYDPLRISTHSVERLISADTSISDAIGFSWSHDGHAFANFTGSNYSRCYDAATGVWHSRESYGYSKWRARYSTRAFDRVIVGDSLTGKIGYLDKDTYTEFGEPMVWGVDSPPLHVFPNGGVVSALHLDLATGYGTLSGQGSDPKIMLQVSKDGGNTFGQYRELSLGVRGKYATRVTARNLGQFGPKGIVFRLRISDPVARGLVGTDVEVKPFKR
jgi:hypothetical protein